MTQKNVTKRPIHLEPNRTADALTRRRHAVPQVIQQRDEEAAAPPWAG
jgi:hypothetical protein